MARPLVASIDLREAGTSVLGGPCWQRKWQEVARWVERLRESGVFAYRVGSGRGSGRGLPAGLMGLLHIRDQSDVVDRDWRLAVWPP